MNRQFISAWLSFILMLNCSVDAEQVTTGQTPAAPKPTAAEPG